MEMRPRAADLGLHTPCAGLDLLAASTFAAVKLVPRGASNAVHITLALMVGCLSEDPRRCGLSRDLVVCVFAEMTKEGRPLLRVRGMRCGRRFTCVRCVDG